uniref:N-acetyltransferase domain-containing protein n=1 Tax=Mycena chlorophos TaxID=658473 RepID=A0ABQ0LKB6_MYCCL|nr:predicted protein [Mycena chlorophos]
MPSSTEPYAAVYFSATAIPGDVWDALHADPRAANVILPIAQKQLTRQTDPSKRGQCWIAVFSFGKVDFVLSVTNGDNGQYPVFIFTPHRPHLRTREFLHPRLLRLAEALHASMPVKRIYSVFAPDEIAYPFVACWTHLTGVQALRDPYYHAWSSYCSRQTFVSPKRQDTVVPGVIFQLRPAVESDLSGVAELCYLFAKESEPFVLTRSAAVSEARKLIQQQQVWVHTIRHENDPACTEHVACIAAFTRNSESVATITKVYTPPDWRRQGCALRLVRRVTKHLLATKQYVALFVGRENDAAHVYHRVGFVGLANDAEEYPSVESWIELGLDPAKVQLGHW